MTNSNQVNHENDSTVADRKTEQGLKRHKIFCFNNGGSPGWYRAMAIAEDGHLLAQHVCSDEGFMHHDLGITSDWKHENYDAHYGAGNWELVWVSDPATNPELDAAYRLNQALRPAPDSVEVNDLS